jgi:hypothetical protein
MGDKSPFTFDKNEFDIDDCNISEVIKFLQKLSRSPNASAINMAFTKHITNALMQMREKKLKRGASIPKKLEDVWEPIIKMKIDGFDCNALCDLGASISVIPRKIYEMLELPPLEKMFWMFILLILMQRNLWGKLIMFLLWFTITWSQFILLF